MKSIHDALKTVDLDGGKVFEDTDGNLKYIVQDTIVHELSRNLLLALTAVFVCTLFLMGDVRPSLIVLFTIIITLVNVGGEIIRIFFE